MKNPEKIIQAVFILLVGLVILGAFFFALNVGFSKSEKAECQKWLRQAADYPLWYSTEWQRNQCAHYEIELPK